LSSSLGYFQYYFYQNKSLFVNKNDGQEIENKKFNETAVKSEHEAKNSILDQSNEYLLKQNDYGSINESKL
jgi:hypothetical protein